MNLTSSTMLCLSKVFFLLLCSHLSSCVAGPIVRPYINIYIYIFYININIVPPQHTQFPRQRDELKMQPCLTGVDSSNVLQRNRHISISSETLLH